MTVKPSTKRTPRRARILFLIHSLGLGGAERIVVDFAKNLDPARYEVHVCTMSDSLDIAGELIDSRVRLHVLRKRGRFDLALVLRLAYLMRRLRPDILSMHCRNAFHFGTPASLLAGIPIRIATEHSVGLGGSRVLNRLAYRLSVYTWTATVAVSDYLKDVMNKTWSIPSKRIQVIHNGVDFSRIPDMSHQQLLRQLLNLPHDACIVGNVSTLRKEKGLKEFLDVAAALLASGVDAHFVIIGGGDLLDELQQHASDVGVRERTHFLGPRNDAPQLMAGFDVFLCTSEVETFGLAIVEAMYMAVPVVAFDVGSLREVVVDGENGFIVSRGDSAGAAARVASLLMSKELRETIGLSASTTAEEKFSVQRMIRGYERLFFGRHRSFGVQIDDEAAHSGDRE